MIMLQLMVLFQEDYILVNYGNGTTNITNSELAYLGYPACKKFWSDILHRGRQYNKEQQDTRSTDGFLLRWVRTWCP